MKKAFSLDYSIERDIDRLQAVNDILDTLDKKPNSTDLELMASYILYGKDENGLNGVQRQEFTNNNTRYSTFTKSAEKKMMSLDALLENPMTDQQALKPVGEKYIYIKKHPPIRRPKYNKATGELIDIGDGDIPGMQELWECIDRLEHVIAVNDGKVPPDEETPIITDAYRLYKLRHQVANMRLNQYYLKDSYKPTIKFLDVRPPQSQFYDWSQDSYYWLREDLWRIKVHNAYLSSVSTNIDDYETRINPDTGQLEVKWIVRQHTFDWENPWHIRQLIEYYGDIMMQLYDNLYAEGRFLIKDFDRYQDMAELSPVRQYILLRKIDKASHAEISQELQQLFGLKYNTNHIGLILHKEIPEKIAATAKKLRLQLDTPEEEKKRCFTCGRFFPRDRLFFSVNKGRRDGWGSNCKKCEKLKRIKKGAQTFYDQRSKDTSMPEMPPSQA